MMVVLAACAELPPGDYALIPLDGQPIQGENFEYDGPSGHYRVSVWEWLETPALDTPALLPTYTPLPTLTPWPTYTPYPTYTPVGVLPSPTPDSEITPAPTIERFCEAQVQGGFHQVRTSRSTDAQALGSMAPSTWMRVERIVRNAQGEWLYGVGENSNGAALTGWALVTPNLVLQDSQACFAVPFEDEVDPLPTTAPPPTPQTVTPVPTEPAQTECTYSHIYPMTIRSGSGTGYARIGTLPANTPVIVGHIYPDTSAERWAFISYDGVTGWVAVRAGSASFGSLSGNCANVPRYQPQLSNPRGLHLIYSANHDAVMAVLSNMGVLKTTDGAEWMLEAAKQINPNITTIHRVIYTPQGKLDCPVSWGVGDPVKAADEWYDMLKPVWASRRVLEYADYIEYRNECRFVGAWEVAFDKRMIERGTASGVCLLAFSDAPGNPEVSEFVQRKPVLDAMLAKPCKGNRYHGIAHHIYYGRGSGSHLFGRYKLFRDALGSKYAPLVWWFTEYGMPAADGTYIGRGAPDCAAVKAEADAIDDLFRRDAQVGGYCAYSVGHGTEWMDLTPCLQLLAA